MQFDAVKEQDLHEFAHKSHVVLSFDRNLFKEHSQIGGLVFPSAQIVQL